MTSEAQLQAAVEAICIRRGLLWHHCSDARKCHGPRGYPDLVVVGPHGIVFAELKSEDGETTGAQDRWAWTIDRVGSLDCKTRLWRPRHLTLGNIEHELGSIALCHHNQ